jgi:predicted Fe-S protein YdhL (DUF1289 family)
MSAITRLKDRAQQVLASYSVHVPSPCVSICVINPNSGLCEGCLRNLEEVAGWGQMPSVQQREVWQRIQKRCEQVM